MEREFYYKPPVIERVNSELIEESALLSSEALHD